MDDWRVAQASCPPQDGFTVVNLWGQRASCVLLCDPAGETPACPTARMAVLR